MAIQFSNGPALSNKQMSAVVKQIAGATVVAPKKARKPGAGRPTAGKETVTLRLREDVVAYYKSLGDDWRGRMAADLAKGAGR